MNVHNLDSIFKPKRIVLIGVSINPNSVSGKVFLNLVGSGFKGVVFPINETSEAVHGVPCYRNLNDIPVIPDLAVICTERETVPDWVRKCGEKGVGGIIIMTAGFRESDERGKELEEEIKKIRSDYKGMRIIGPNCLGIIVPSLKLNLSFAPTAPKAGNIAFISQSGALCTSVLDWAQERNIGFSFFISLGNTIDIDFGHLIDYLGADDLTYSILLYIESISDPKRFMSASRSFARSKPIIVYKSGRFPESAAVAASHTGALASEDSIYDAVFQRTGLARVYQFSEIFDCTELIGRNKIPDGPRLGIVTNAGGPGVMATDSLIELKGIPALFTEETMEELDSFLPPMWSHGNPVDVLGDDRSKRISKASQAVIKDKNVDALLVILTPQAMTNINSASKAIVELSKTTRKPILAAWMGGKRMRNGGQILNDAGVAVFNTPEQAVRAFMVLVDYARNLKTLYETPEYIPIEFSPEREKIRKDLIRFLKDRSGILSEEKSKEILEAYNIPVSKPSLAINEEDAVKIAGKTGYPVVLKISSPDISHKSDMGGVELNVKTPSQVKTAFRKIMQNIKIMSPDADIKGITIQKMVKMEDQVELILGIKKDPVFGTIILSGTGGVTAELISDKSLGFPPLNERLARRMLEGLKIWPLLKGYRGSKPVDITKLIEIMIKLSYIATDFPEIAELDINPLMVSHEGVSAVDARIIMDMEFKRINEGRFPHLSIIPYPEEYVSDPITIDGIEIILRPIRPEDEDMWFGLLEGCSRESIYSRFNHFFHWSSHDIATRFCYIDYDREIAIVAEIEEEGEKKLIGVGRLISDPEHDSVEYAILITDKWQNREIGGYLTDYCMDIAGKWGLKKIVAQTTSDNHRMISVFKKRGFSLTFENNSTTVNIEKIIE